MSAVACAGSEWSRAPVGKNARWRWSKNRTGSARNDDKRRNSRTTVDDDGAETRRRPRININAGHDLADRLSSSVRGPAVRITRGRRQINSVGGGLWRGLNEDLPSPPAIGQRPVGFWRKRESFPDKDYSQWR